MHGQNHTKFDITGTWWYT